MSVVNLPFLRKNVFLCDRKMSKIDYKARISHIIVNFIWSGTRSFNPKTDHRLR